MADRGDWDGCGTGECTCERYPHSPMCGTPEMPAAKAARAALLERLANHTAMCKRCAGSNLCPAGAIIRQAAGAF